MKIAIMQPYFVPYIGYFQLMGAVDLFILQDTKYTKKGWINRNRILQGGRDAVITIPLRAGADSLRIGERELADDFRPDKLANRIREAYRRAPGFAPAMALVESILDTGERNLFAFLRRSLVLVRDFLGLPTPFADSADFGVAEDLRGEARVIALCKAAGASSYVNPIGGVELYAHERFRDTGVDLGFLRVRPFEYAQFGATFVPWLSIVDVIMFNDLDAIRDRLRHGFDVV